MLASCDFKGEFNIVGFPPKAVLLVENAKTIKMLNDAFIYRNKKSWFSYSKDVCQFFNPVKYPKLFDGQILTVSKFVNWAKKQYFELQAKANKNPLDKKAKK